METKTRRVLICCLPALILLSIALFGLGLIPNRASIPAFVMVLALGLIISKLLFLLLSGKKTGIKLSSLALWLFIFILAVVFSVFMPRTVHRSTKADAVSRFEARVSGLSYATEFDSLEVGSAYSAEYHSFSKSEVFFESQSCALICRYDEGGYEEALASIEDRYDFRTKQLETGRPGDKNQEKTTVPYAVIGDDCFRVVSPGDYSSTPFYKECLLIMNNDVKRAVAYIAFSDVHLDYGDELAEFINESCGWKYIRE